MTLKECPFPSRRAPISSNLSASRRISSGAALLPCHRHVPTFSIGKHPLNNKPVGFVPARKTPTAGWARDNNYVIFLVWCGEAIFSLLTKKKKRSKRERKLWRARLFRWNGNTFFFLEFDEGIEWLVQIICRNGKFERMCGRGGFMIPLASINLYLKGTQTGS